MEYYDLVEDKKVSKEYIEDYLELIDDKFANYRDYNFCKIEDLSRATHERPIIKL